MSRFDLPDGGSLSFVVRGEGSPLLLLRPLGGSRISWGRFEDALARHLQVISFDPRGSGLSSAAPLGTTTRQMAKDAVALLDHLSIPSADVYGISLGGMVASWLAVDSPSRVNKLILASTLPKGLMVRLGAWTRGVAIARCLLSPPAEMEAGITERILSRIFREKHPDQVERIKDEARENPATRMGILTLVKAAALHDIRARLHDIQADTLVLIGERDPLLTLESQRTLLGNIPHATYEVLPGVGHDLSAEAPISTAARLLQAVRDPSEPPGTQWDGNSPLPGLSRLS